MSQEFVLTKIIATLGPATASPDAIVRLIEAGTRVFRINFSHGTFDQFQHFHSMVRQASELTGRYVGILGDLSGPKFRVGKLPPEGVVLRDGNSVRFSEEPAFAEEGCATLQVTLRGVLAEIRPGQRVLLDDGNVALVCTVPAEARERPVVQCRVLAGGTITSGKGINLPDTDLSLPALTEWDWACVDFAVEQDFDFLALSFVRNAADVRLLKDRLRRLGARPQQPKTSGSGPSPKFSSYGGGSQAFLPVIAKIEKPQALDDLEQIVEEADAIMVARGDLGVEMDLAQVPVIQKRIIRVCHDHGKPAIVATQMLQSMITSPVPTRAEASDVANAIFDGADAVMLSGETAVGAHPEAAVHTIRRIARETNAYQLREKSPPSPPAKLRESKYRTAALAHGVSVIVKDLDAHLVVMWSQFGGGASYISQNRLRVPVIAFSSSPEALRRMSLLYGILPRCMAQPKSVAQFVADVDRLLVANSWAGPGDSIVLVLGEPIGEAGLTNKIRIHYVGDPV